ncbi:uncharacterized protein LOC108677820 [Hyalella azteca]|uniref:Uncharacterized protein LOC108677820 n=1 Tax=Hyalella azteca TaxID=294128 RepID=A0A979FVG5_HYAAZ|nr:uncharacterized protein LOC108677820 [Hyalella azteca]
MRKLENKRLKLALVITSASLVTMAVMSRHIQLRVDVDKRVPEFHTQNTGLAENEMYLRRTTNLAQRHNDVHVTCQIFEEKISELNQRLTRISKSLERLWCATKDVMSTGGFCVTADRLYTGGNSFFDPEMCYFVEALVGNVSIADFGAGLGKYGMCFLRKNQTEFRLDDKQRSQYIADLQTDLNDIQNKPQIVYSWHGFDGGIDIEEVSGGFIAHADLSEEGLWLGRRWDWVMSIEVGEHIHPKHEDFFLDNLIRHACAGIILTWAVEGQPGHYHVNNHNNDYIKQRMRDKGLIVDEDAEKLLRQVTRKYLINTPMVFRLPSPKSCLTK